MVLVGKIWILHGESECKVDKNGVWLQSRGMLRWKTLSYVWKHNCFSGWHVCSPRPSLGRVVSSWLCWALDGSWYPLLYRFDNTISIYMCILWYIYIYIYTFMIIYVHVYIYNYIYIVYSIPTKNTKVYELPKLLRQGSVSSTRMLTCSCQFDPLSKTPTVIHDTERIIEGGPSIS